MSRYCSTGTAIFRLVSLGFCRRTFANADYVIDMGPGGGDVGGKIVAAGTPDEIKACRESVAGRYL